MKKRTYQHPAQRVISLDLTSEVLINMSWETTDNFSRKKELFIEDEENDTPNRFGYWD